MKNKFWAVFLLALVLCLLPSVFKEALADRTITIDDDKGRLILLNNRQYKFENEEAPMSYTGSLIITQERSTARYTKGIVVRPGTHNLTLRSVKIEPPAGISPIELEPGAILTLTIADNSSNTLTGKSIGNEQLYAGGIYVPSDAKLTIRRATSPVNNGTPGQLIATAGDLAAGIGGVGGDGNSGNAGDIIIQGGIIRVIGGHGAAGIGGGMGGKGNVTITGGKVLATSGKAGAGIGGGAGGKGVVAIEGGELTVTSTESGAGIGGGQGAEGIVTLTGGMGSSMSNGSGAGIGSGSGGKGTVEISNGAFQAVSNGGGAGIGAGAGGEGYVTVNAAYGMSITAKGVCALGGITSNGTLNGNVTMTGVKLHNPSNPSETTNAYSLESEIVMQYSGAPSVGIASSQPGAAGGSFTGSAVGVGDVTLKPMDDSIAEMIADTMNASPVAWMDASGTSLDNVAYTLNNRIINGAGGPFGYMSILHQGASGQIDVLNTTEISHDGLITYIGDVSGSHGSPFVLVGYKNAPKPPKTGDAATPWLWLCLCAAGFGGVLLLRRKARRA